MPCQQRQTLRKTSKVIQAFVTLLTLVQTVTSFLLKSIESYMQMRNNFRNIVGNVSKCLPQRLLYDAEDRALVFYLILTFIRKLFETVI